MANKRTLLLMGILVVTMCGCRSVSNVRVTPGQPSAATPEEAQKLRVDGLALYAQQPRALASVGKAAEQLEQAAAMLHDDYDAQWQAAQVLAFLAENETRAELRLQAARRGVVLARQARTLKPEGVEGHYWYAINVGLLANEDRTYGLSAVKEMETALRSAMQIDEHYDLAGPPRVLGILQLRTPPPPTSIGSPRKALRLLEHAVALFPNYPENYLYLAEALHDNGRADDAKEALRKVLEAKPWPEPTVRESAVENGGAQAARPLGQAVKKRSALFWVTVSLLTLVAAVAGAFTIVHISKHMQARHDVQVIAIGMDGFAMENGDYPQGTRGEICRMLRGESVNGQNLKKLDYVEAMPTEMDGEFVDPWGQPYRISVDPKARVYSTGPNRIDEHGDGDDIVSWK